MVIKSYDFVMREREAIGPGLVPALQARINLATTLLNSKSQNPNYN